MDTRDIYKLVRQFEEEKDDVINLYDSMDIELNEGFVIETGVVGFTKDGVIVHLDEDAMEFLDFNGVLLESEQFTESEDDNSSDAVRNAVTNRIIRQHPEVLAKFGPEAVMAAVDDIAYYLDDLEEIGSSDVSIWTKQVIQDLEAGHYKHLHEEMVDRDEHGNVTARGDEVDIFKAKVAKDDDAFDMVYDAISGKYGEKIRTAIQEIYDDIVIDSHGRLHPDDDFEQIISRVVDNLESDYGVVEGAYSDHWDSKYDDDSTDPSVTPKDKERAAGRRRAEDDGWDPKRDEIDELAAIKRLAGHEEVEEGLGKALLGGAALIAAITGLNKMEANRMMKTEPQLIALAQMRQEAAARGDEYEVKELDDRIQKTMDHISVTGRPVMGPDGKPVNPREPVGEAEYQGRKVPLNKPMAGDVKKSKVYVKKPNGKVVKVNFGDKNMRIKKSNPNRRKSFRARHRCENPGPKWKARYWSCRAW